MSKEGRCVLTKKALACSLNNPLVRKKTLAFTLSGTGQWPTTTFICDAQGRPEFAIFKTGVRKPAGPRRQLYTCMRVVQLQQHNVGSHRIPILNILVDEDDDDRISYAHAMRRPASTATGDYSDQQRFSGQTDGSSAPFLPGDPTPVDGPVSAYAPVQGSVPRPQRRRQSQASRRKRVIRGADEGDDSTSEDDVYDLYGDNESEEEEDDNGDEDTEESDDGDAEGDGHDGFASDPRNGSLGSKDDHVDIVMPHSSMSTAGFGSESVLRRPRTSGSRRSSGSPASRARSAVPADGDGDDDDAEYHPSREFSEPRSAGGRRRKSGLGGRKDSTPRTLGAHVDARRLGHVAPLSIHQGGVPTPDDPSAFPKVDESDFHMQVGPQVHSMGGFPAPNLAAMSHGPFQHLHHLHMAQFFGQQQLFPGSHLLGLHSGLPLPPALHHLPSTLTPPLPGLEPPAAPGDTLTDTPPQQEATGSVPTPAFTGPHHGAFSALPPFWDARHAAPAQNMSALHMLGVVASATLSDQPTVSGGSVSLESGTTQGSA
jgi:hypothetical protein